MKLTVTIPATSANLGPGFDCMGIALQIYNTVDVEETDQGLYIKILDDTRDFLPQDGRNLVYRSMQTVFDITGYTPKGISITLNNRIPVTRGLGSSSAGIVGGLLAANKICGDALSVEKLMMIAADIEGHPDNSTPAFTGGLTIATMDDRLEYKSVKINNDKLRFAVFVPKFILRTQKSRSVLPRLVTHKDAVFNVGHASMLVAAIMSEDYSLIKNALKDRLHQPYRRKLIPGMKDIFDASPEFGALGAYISGAGPTIIAMLEQSAQADFEEKMSTFINRYMTGWSMNIVSADNNGAVVTLN